MDVDCEREPGDVAAKAGRRSLEEVRPLPGSGLGTRELPPWDAKNVVCFAGREHWLANFYRDAPVFIDGHQYPTVEHYYQVTPTLILLTGTRY